MEKCTDLNCQHLYFIIFVVHYCPQGIAAVSRRSVFEYGSIRVGRHLGEYRCPSNCQYMAQWAVLSRDMFERQSCIHCEQRHRGMLSGRPEFLQCRHSRSCDIFALRGAVLSYCSPNCLPERVRFERVLSKVGSED